MTEQPNDLRRPDPEETELSPEEVELGVWHGIIPPGPRAQARAFAEVFVLERRRVQVWQIGTEAA